MGCWGPGNFDSDGALGVLDDYCEKLIAETLELANSKSAAEYDEYAHDQLFVNLEILFALSRNRLLRGHPEPDEVLAAKEGYLARWQAYMDKSANVWPERRAVIEETFDRFAQICQQEQKRVESLPQWVEIPAAPHPAPAEPTGPHLIFGTYGLAVPETWTASTNTVPPDSLLHFLFPVVGDVLRLPEAKLRLDRVYHTTGPSAQSSPRPPYVLLAELSIAEGDPAFSASKLEDAIEEKLQPHFEGEDANLETGYLLDRLEEFHFAGMAAWRRSPSTSSALAPQFYQSLFLHSPSKRRFLLLEFASLQQGFSATDCPDEHLVESIYCSLTAAQPED